MKVKTIKKIVEEIESKYFEFVVVGANASSKYTAIQTKHSEVNKNVLVFWLDSDGNVTNYWYSSEDVMSYINSGRWEVTSVLDKK